MRFPLSAGQRPCSSLSLAVLQELKPSVITVNWVTSRNEFEVLSWTGLQGIKVL